ncbi:MAG: DUF3127 domain-containing protein [Paludibacteraceae bacterium]|nr:DUF3127 domain-containing protein [Paludibacteraceae bacterium]MBR6043430.1 DUF3127 domain-containing protein [Paludibacteraceae bacterium]
MDITGQQLEATGRVIAVLPIRTGTSAAGTEWASQDYVIEYSEPSAQYPRRLNFNIFGSDKIQQSSQLLQVGNTVKVSFDIDAREYQGRWFTSIRAWKVEAAGAAVPNAAAAAAAQPMQPGSAPQPIQTAAPAQQTDDSSDLPF